MAPRKRRLQQRLKSVGAQVEESIRQDGDDHKLQHKASEDLFQIDNAGETNTVSKRKLNQQKLANKDPTVKSHKFHAAKASKFEQERVKKIQANQQQEKPAPKAEKKKEEQSTTQIWGAMGELTVPKSITELDEYVAEAVVKPVKRRKLVASTKYKVDKVQVAAPGQSYHPDFETHQDVMAEAVAKELERQDARKKLAEPLRAGLSEETLQHINMNSDDESEEESDDDLDESSIKKQKRPQQVTRSQRNKRARHKQLEMQHQVRRGNKAMVKQINAAQHILQDIVRDEKASEQKQTLKKLMEQQKLEEEPVVRVGGKLTKIERETPVSFAEDLTGNMRTLKPKGNPLLDRFDSLHKRNMIEIGGPKKTRKRKVRIIEAKK